MSETSSAYSMNILGPKCLGSEVSQVRSVRTPSKPLPSYPVLPVGRFSRQIGLVLETVGGEILRFGGWLVFGLVLNDVCGFLGG